MTLLDGVVVARSTYNTDINYRSVVIIGKASEVTDPDEKRRGLDCLVDHILPGRCHDARPPTDKEVRSTMLLKMAILEASAKVRTGWPLDDEADCDLPIWAGVLAARTSWSPPETDPLLRFDLDPPPSLVGYGRGRPGNGKSGPLGSPNGEA